MPNLTDAQEKELLNLTLSDKRISKMLKAAIPVWKEFGYCNNSFGDFDTTTGRIKVKGPCCLVTAALSDHPYNGCGKIERAAVDYDMLIFDITNIIETFDCKELSLSKDTVEIRKILFGA